MSIHLLITTDGKEIDLGPGPHSRKALLERMGATTIDTVALRSLGRPLHIMFVDDLGWETAIVDRGGGRFEILPTRPRKPINEKATQLYWSNAVPTTHTIVGDVIILPDDEELLP